MNIPRPIFILIAAFVAIQFFFVLTDEMTRAMTIINFALYPIYFATDWNVQTLATLITHGFLHGGWTHCLINSLWLLAFGAPVAWRLGTTRFFFLYFTCTILAGLTQVLVSFPDNALTPIIGASGGVSACMGAATRFAFIYRAGAGAPLLPIKQIPQVRPVFLFIIIWVMINLVFGIVPLLSNFGDMTGSVAWQAHIAGFFAGLFLIGYFEPPPRSPSGGPGKASYGNWH